MSVVLDSVIKAQTLGSENLEPSCDGRMTNRKILAEPFFSSALHGRLSGVR